MTLQQFEQLLKQVCPETYELAAPKGVPRFVVWHTYGYTHMYGDDGNLVDLPKIQLDIVTNRKNDSLAGDICYALYQHCIAYSVQSEGYDPDYNAYRMILQLVVI